MFVSRSSFEKPSPFERWVRTASPSRYSTSKPEPSSSGPTICAIVVLPAPESPVNQSVKPLRMCLLWQRGVVVDPALELVRAGPTAGPLLLVRRGRTRARPAADRAVAGVVERVVRDLVGRDERLQPLLVPVRERMELPDVVALRPLELRDAGAARGLISADARDPRRVRLERRKQRSGSRSHRFGPSSRCCSATVISGGAGSSERP